MPETLTVQQGGWRCKSAALAQSAGGGFCSECGVQFEPGTTFCSECGTPTGQPDNTGAHLSSERIVQEVTNKHGAGGSFSAVNAADHEESRGKGLVVPNYEPMQTYLSDELARPKFHVPASVKLLAFVVTLVVIVAAVGKRRARPAQ